MSKIKYKINENNCCIWENTSPNGYPHNAHRRYFKKYKGIIPEDYQIDHLCRNRACVNPEHLEAVKQRENIYRGLATKLKDEDIKKIKELKGKIKQNEIAKIFNITQAHVSRIGRERRIFV